MKSEREFLDSIWDRIAETEYEEEQKRLSKIRNTAIIKKNIAIHSAFIFLYAIILFLTLFTEIPEKMFLVFIFSIIALSAGYFIERTSFTNKQSEVRRNEG